jgi:hypothetical protein
MSFETRRKPIFESALKPGGLELVWMLFTDTTVTFVFHYAFTAIAPVLHRCKRGTSKGDSRAGRFEALLRPYMYMFRVACVACDVVLTNR